MSRVFVIIGILFCAVIMGSVALKGWDYYRVFSILSSFDKFAIDFYRYWNDSDYEKIYNELADGTLREALEPADFEEFLEVFKLSYGRMAIKENVKFRHSFDGEAVLLTVQCQVTRSYGKFQETFEAKYSQKTWSLLNYYFTHKALYSH